MTHSKVYFGVDVAKATLQLCGPGLPGQPLPNTAAGHRALLKLLPANSHVVCEATGGYERAMVCALHQAGRLVSVINPQRTSAAARAAGQRAKSDPIDAAELADYGRRYEPAPTLPLSATQRTLQELVRRRTQLVELQTAETNQLEHLEDPRLCTQARRRLKRLAADLLAIAAWIAHTIKTDAALAAKAARLDAVEGFAATNIAVVLAEVPELGSIPEAQAAHLFGVAPFIRQSGCFKGQSHIGGGRAPARRALYMAALTAIVHNHRLRDLYQRLLARGKPTKVALVAVMRKLACLLNRLLRNPDFQLAA